MLTINGRVQLWRRRWHSPDEGTTTPLDSWLDIIEGTISLGVREMACRLNGDGKNFDKAAANLARTAQITLSGETLRGLVESEGKRVLQAQQSGRLAVDWSAADCQTEEKTTRVYFGSDGVMVPLVTDAEKKSRRQKVKEKRRGKKVLPLSPRKEGADQHYKEFKIVAFYDETQSHRLVSGTRGDHEAAGRLMRREASRIRLDLADEKVGNVDGSPWIRNQVQRQCLPLDDLGLDFYHLSENAHKARREIYGEDGEAGKQWVEKLLHTFKHEGYEPTWQLLLEWRVGLRRGQRAAGNRLLNYVSERRDMIKYPEFLAKNWQIGSGPTEATCKTLTARLKGSGMRWDADNAEAVMALEALTQSGKRPFPKEDLAMESKPTLSRDEYIEQMRQEMEEMLGKVADAINEAPAGYVISGSEEKVRNLFADLRRRAYEKGLQMRVDAAEAAFPPSEGLGHGEDQAQ